MGECSLGKTNTNVKANLKAAPKNDGNKSWYKAYCSKCPYLVNDEIMKKLHCVRPIGEECLAEGILVAGVIMAGQRRTMIKEQLTMKEQYEERKMTLDNSASTQKRRNKIYKRRR